MRRQRIAKRVSVVIRDARDSDLRGIIRCYWRDPEVPWDPYLHIDILRRYIGLRGFLVAKTRGKIVGFLHYRVFRKHPWFDPKVGHYGQIFELHVLPRFQSTGIGSRLLSEAFKRLERTGCDAVYIETDEKNDAALRLYRHFGLEPFLKRLLLKSGTIQRKQVK